MVKSPKQLAKRIGIDIAGFGLLLAALLTGWLPGPGGIPLAIAGLSLLAINYQWARTLQDKVKEKSVDIIDRIFPNNPNIQMVYDLAFFLLAASAVFLFRDHHWQIGAVIGGLALAIAILNRSRGERLFNWLKKLTRRN